MVAALEFNVEGLDNLPPSNCQLIEATMWYETLLTNSDSSKIDLKDTLDVEVSDDELAGLFDAFVVRFDRRGV